MINIVNMNKSFDERVIFKDFNLDVKDKSLLFFRVKVEAGTVI